MVVVPVTHEAVYFVMADPPSELGAVKAMLALRLPAVARPIVGAPGTVAPKAPLVRLVIATIPNATKTRLKADICEFIIFS